MNEYNEKVDYLIYETSLARMERVNKRFFIMCIICFMAFVISNLAWLHYEFQFEDTVITQENADGINNYIGNDGDITNGKTDD